MHHDLGLIYAVTCNNDDAHLTWFCLSVLEHPCYEVWIIPDMVP